jgi:hypothetical protein
MINDNMTTGRTTALEKKQSTLGFSTSDLSKRPPRYLDSITSEQFYKRFKKVRNAALKSREVSKEKRSRNEDGFR